MQILKVLSIFFVYSTLKSKVVLFTGILIMAAQFSLKRGEIDPENRLVPDIYLFLLVLFTIYYILMIYRDARSRYTTLKANGKI
jgi:hypothetical protein